MQKVLLNTYIRGTVNIAIIFEIPSEHKYYEFRLYDYKDENYSTYCIDDNLFVTIPANVHNCSSLDKIAYLTNSFVYNNDIYNNIVDVSKDFKIRSDAMLNILHWFGFIVYHCDEIYNAFNSFNH